LRFAEVGITAIALDYFGRTAGLTSRDEPFEFMPHVQQLQLDSFFADVAASLTALKERGSADGPVYVVGFCMGGSLTLLSGTNPDFGFTGLIPFYAGMTRNFGGKGTVLEHAHNVKYPVLALFGGNDPGIPQSNIDEFEQKLNQAGVKNEVVVYEGAPHSFFDRTASQYAEASANAWERIMAFVKD
jgi:carboxymethylenebutenolidase